MAATTAFFTTTSRSQRRYWRIAIPTATGSPRSARPDMNSPRSPSEMPSHFEDRAHHEVGDQHDDREREPLELLALDAPRPSEPDDHRDDGEEEEPKEGGPQAHLEPGRRFEGRHVEGIRELPRSLGRDIELGDAEAEDQERERGQGEPRPLERPPALRRHSPVGEPQRQQDQQREQGDRPQRGPRPAHPRRCRSRSVFEEVDRPFGARERDGHDGRHPQHQDPDPVAGGTAQAEGADDAHPHERQEVRACLR